MTETAQMADIVLPATMFLEHDDVYQGGGHQYILLGPKLVEPPGECRSNHEVICALAKRVGARASGLRDDPARADRLRRCRNPAGARSPSSRRKRWIDCQPDFETAHYINGFDWPDGKFRFKPDWPNVPFRSPAHARPGRRDAGAAGPLGRRSRRRTRRIRSGSRRRRRATSSTRPSTRRRPRWRARSGRTVMIHPDDAAAAGIADGD